MNLTAKYDELPKWVKIIIQVCLWGWAGAAYRILRFVENKNVANLVIGILSATILNFVFGIIDLVTMITQEKISVLIY